MQNQKITQIHNTLSPAALYGQLAEECAELAQVALKLQRLCMKENPPRKAEEELMRSLQEEISDVELCIECIGFSPDETYFDNTSHKIDRWLSIIEKDMEG